VARSMAGGCPLPRAIGFFSGSAEIARAGDSEAFTPQLQAGKSVPDVIRIYLGDADPLDPMVSPLFGDLSGLPPTMVMTSTRDLLLSQSCLLHLALREAGVPCELLVYEGLPHAFWAGVDCPETTSALSAQASFLGGHIKS